MKVPMCITKKINVVNLYKYSNTQVEDIKSTCVNYRSPFIEFEELCNTDNMVVEFDTTDNTYIYCTRKNEMSYVKLLCFFKTIVQCIPDENYSIIKHIEQSLMNITHNVHQKFLEEKGEGYNTFGDAELFCTEMPSDTRKQKLKQNHFTSTYELLLISLFPFPIQRSHYLPKLNTSLTYCTLCVALNITT